MRFPSPLEPAILLKRYKRFLADVSFADGRTAVAHIANPGAMLGLATPGAQIWLSRADNPRAQLAWRWELESVEGALVGVNTQHPNRIVGEALAQEALAPFHGYPIKKPEVRYDENSRIDWLLEGPQGQCFIEVKNVHMKRADCAEFPDSVTRRGTKHLEALTRCVQNGHRASVIFCIQRSDIKGFRLACDIDPDYALAAQRAHAAGVQFLAYACKISTDEITLDPFPIAHATDP